mgnify:CR=1 FL=1
MLQQYMNENNSGFMQYVSDNFEGDLAALENAIDDDFAFLNNIRILTSIIRISPFRNTFDLDFTYSRTVQSATTGQTSTDSAASSMTFVLTDEGVKLISMAAPLIFGVSNTAEVATEIQTDSIGQEVLVVTNTGDTTTVTQV